MIERAHGEAEAIVAKAKTDAEALVERRGRMAEDKIAAEERAAIDELRATAAEAATRAAAKLIAERNDAGEPTPSWSTRRSPGWARRAKRPPRPDFRLLLVLAAGLR